MVKKNIKNISRLAKPTFNNQTFLEVKKILKSGNLVQGKKVAEFEKKLNQYLKIKNAIVVSSGTAALHLSLIALGVGRGDEVIIPAFSYIATANVVELVGAKPVLVDINLDDCCININKIEKNITKKTKAIIPVHEFGNPAEIKEISKIAKKYNLYVIEDSACALGSTYNNNKVGTFGDVGCFSFHPRKLITTGEGGAVITKNNKIAKKIKYLRNHGINKTNNTQIVENAGFNYRMTEFQAVLGIDQLKKIDSIIKHNYKLAKFYIKNLDGIDYLTLPILKKKLKTNFQSFHIIVKKNINRNDLIKYLKLKKIESNYGAQSIHTQKFYKNKYNFKKNHFPNAYYAFTKGIVLPIGYHINLKEINNIISYIKSFKKNK